MSKSIKDKILRVLESFADKQVNLGSSAAREIIANKIDARLDSYNPNEHNIYSGDPEMNDLLEIQASWVCMKCGKSTFHVDYDYLVHPKLHLGCALEEELNGKDIKTQYHEASALSFKQKTTMSPQLEITSIMKRKYGKALISNCCGAPPLHEIYDVCQYDLLGLCSQCKDNAVFTTDDEDG